MLRLLALLIASLFLAAPMAHAARRTPQAQVTGSALASFFAAQGQSINVNTDQVAMQQLSMPAASAFEVRVFPSVSGVAFGVHNAASGSPQLYSLLPATATAGWYAQCAFQSSPSRLVVTYFDETSTQRGTNTYKGVDRSGFGFYGSSGAGTYYMTDARNPGGSAKILAYAGTGTRTGWTWLACETSNGSGGDYADYVALVNLSLATVPVRHTGWGALKQLYR